MSGDILDAIDGAIADYRTSGDAMRWTPEPSTNRQATGRVRILLDAAAFIGDMRRVGEQLQRQAVAMNRAAAKIGGRLSKSLKPTSATAHQMVGHSDRLTRVRCRTCNPRGNPPPSPHGAAYRRRQRARRRRSR